MLSLHSWKKSLDKFTFFKKCHYLLNGLLISVWAGFPYDW